MILVDRKSTSSQSLTLSNDISLGNQKVTATFPSTLPHPLPILCPPRPSPAFSIMEATSLHTIAPRLRILLCFEYGRYGITPTILRHDAVRHAYAKISISMMSSFTFLQGKVVYDKRKGKGQGSHENVSHAELAPRTPC
jgi:hypothetical protein